MWTDIIQPHQGLARTKCQREGEFSVLALKLFIFFCSWMSELPVLGPSDSETSTRNPLGSQDFGLDLNHTIDFLFLQLEDVMSRDFLAYVTAISNCHNKFSLLYVSIYIPSYIYPMSQENSNTSALCSKIG